MEAFSDEQIAAIRDSILGEHGGELLEFVHLLKISQYSGGASEASLALASGFGWIEGARGNPRLTRAGEIAGDPIREYMFWRERGRTVHMADRLERFRAGSFEGQRVLEIGSGFGCNLFSIAEHAERAVGVDIEPQYVQFTGIFAELEGIEPPEVLTAPGENLPFADASFDHVLILGSLQYMDIGATIAESARVLCPGGIFVTVQSTLAQIVASAFSLRGRGNFLREVKADLVTLAETLSYEILGRRLRAIGDHSTARPVYPSVRFICRQLEAHGLAPDLEAMETLDNETVFQAVRRPLA